VSDALLAATAAFEVLGLCPAATLGNCPLAATATLNLGLALAATPLGASLSLAATALGLGLRLATALNLRVTAMTTLIRLCRSR
jgi:hypothetical protein